MMAPNTTLPSASFAFVVLVRIVLQFYSCRSSWVACAARKRSHATVASSDYSRVAAVCPPVFPLAVAWAGDLSVGYYVDMQDVIQCVVEDAIARPFLDLIWRHKPCQGRPHPICLQNCVRSIPQRLPMWWPRIPRTPFVWGSTTHGARIGTLIRRCVACILSWGQSRDMRLRASIACRIRIT